MWCLWGNSVSADDCWINCWCRLEPDEFVSRLRNWGYPGFDVSGVEIYFWRESCIKILPESGCVLWRLGWIVRYFDGVPFKKRFEWPVGEFCGCKDCWMPSFPCACDLLSEAADLRYDLIEIDWIEQVSGRILLCKVSACVCCKSDYCLLKVLWRIVLWAVGTDYKDGRVSSVPFDVVDQLLDVFDADALGWSKSRVFPRLIICKGWFFFRIGGIFKFFNWVVSPLQRYLCEKWLKAKEREQRGRT